MANFQSVSINVQYVTAIDVFLPKFRADLSRYKEMRVHCTRYKKTPTLHRHFAPLWPTALEILTHEIRVRPTYACKILSRSIKVWRSYSQKADFEEMHITLSCICITAYN